jgi:type III secretion protein T
MQNNYADFFRHIYQFTPTSLVPIFLLLLCRLAPIVVIAPFLASKLPSILKMGVIVSLAMVLFPIVTVKCETIIDFNIIFIAYAIKELFIGFILAFLVMIPFQIVQSSGVLIDFLRGASSLQVGDPFSQAQTSPIGNLYNYMLIAMFYAMGGFFYFMDSLFNSYILIPLDAFINPLFFTLEQPFWQIITALVTKVFALSIQLAAPSLMAILMTEVFLGIANRLAPQVQIAFLGMSVKSLLGLALLCISWFFILQQVEKQTLLWLKEIDGLLLCIPPTAPPS